MGQVLALRHVCFEDLGLLQELFTERGHTVSYRHPAVDELGELDPLLPDLLVILGGPIGVYETTDYPFLAAEVSFIAKRLEERRPTLGLCLGAQLMAVALGSRVYPAGAKEIGWAPVALTEAGHRSCLRHLKAPVLHWHGDTFDLPEEAERLASTEICENQAFRWGDTALALQFHAEAAGRDLERWFIGHTAEINATAGVSVPQLRADTARWSEEMTRNGRRCFDEWLSSAGL